jgi:non-specific serine/threonine protein kinase
VLPPTTALEGQLVLQYRVVRRLGGGGMGEVYLAEDTRLGRQVALKFLAPSAQHDQESRERLVREARAASMLRSPNIAVTYDLVEHGDALFIAMEYVDGETVGARLARGPIPVKEAIDIAAQVADALEDAHAHDIVHRDIKSANLMLTRRGLVKVLDFGLARFGQIPASDAVTMQVTSPGIVVGTIAYMAPEQLLGGAADHRVDIFGLGVVLYEMLSGRRPFEGQTFAEITDRVLHADPDPLASSASPVPPALDAIVRRALQKNAAFRYQTARDLYTDLHQLGRRLDALDTSRAMLPVSASMPQVHEPDPLTAPRSIAVMSFDNLTRNGSADWSGEGIAETVTSDLKNLGGLSVISRTQVFEGLKNLPAAHTADNRAAIELGRHLGASWVVTGAYQRLGPRVRITAQVVDMATAALIKTLKIDGAVDEIFELQDRIVFELSRSLDLVVERPAAEAIATDETTSVEAFEAYSRGLVNLRQATRDSIERAIALFEHATELDPRYARAWASLGGAFQIKGMFLAMPEFTERAIDRLQRAIALAPSFAEAHASLGLSLLNLGRIEEAESCLRRAVSLDENNTTAVQGLARALWLGQARVEEAIQYLHRATELNPDGGYSYLQLSFLQSLDGDLDAAETSARHAIDLQERAMSGTEGLLIVGAHARLGYVFYRRGEYDRAREEYRRELDFLTTTDHALRERTLVELHQKLSAVNDAAGEHDTAERWGQLAIEEMDRRIAVSADDPATRYYAAAVYARRGDVAQTLAHLAFPLRQFAQFTRWRLERDPDFDRVRGERAFIDAIRSAAV